MRSIKFHYHYSSVSNIGQTPECHKKKIASENNISGLSTFYYVQNLKENNEQYKNPTNIFTNTSIKNSLQKRSTLSLDFNSLKRFKSIHTLENTNRQNNSKAQIIMNKILGNNQGSSKFKKRTERKIYDVANDMTYQTQESKKFQQQSQQQRINQYKIRIKRLKQENYKQEQIDINISDNLKKDKSTSTDIFTNIIQEIKNYQSSKLQYIKKQRSYKNIQIDQLYQSPQMFDDNVCFQNNEIQSNIKPKAL